MLRARLLLADLVGLCIEGASIGVPAYLLYGVQYGRAAEQSATEVEVPGINVLRLGSQLTRPVLVALIVFSVVHALWQERHLRELRRAAARKPEGNADEVYALATNLPRQSLWVRTILWALCGVLCAAWLHFHGVVAADLLPLLWLFSLNPLLAGAVHSLIYDRLLWGVPWRALPKGPDPLRRFAARYTAELERAVLLTTAMALLCTVGFTISVPFDLEHFQRAQRYLPALIFLLLYAGYRYGALSRQPIQDYLRATLRHEGTDAGLALLAVRAYQTAQALPYRLGAAMVVAGVVAAVMLLGLFLPLLDMPGESLLLILGIALSVTTAASLYAIMWHRATLRPLLGHLQERCSIYPDKVRAPLSLTAKIVGSFGLLIVCTCTLSLVWSFVQYKTLATRHIQRLARDRLDALLADLQKELSRDPQTGQVDMARRLQHLTGPSGIGRECLVYYLADGDSAAQVVGHPAGMTPPPLPAATLSQLRRRSTGQIELPRLRLTGEYERVRRLPGQEELLGAVAVLYPDYLHPGFHGTQGAPLRGQLLALVFFFIVLLFVSGGIVVIAAVDLARPVRYLERRAAAMAEGDLLLPVVQTAVETDEVGRLTFAFEEMRRALSEKLRSSTQLNLRLEAEVARRTAELSRRNEEVSDALTRLQLTRDELLRTEKLATMGRIAAGVTSEINNPVNVMVTIPDPISEELDELLRLSQKRPLDRARIGMTLAEVRQMVDVLLRGAQRAKEIVRATRVYVRAGDGPAGPFDLNQAVDEVLQLFADLPRYSVSVVREYEENLQIVSARGDLGQILSSWLARITPRLRDAHRSSATALLRVRTRRRSGADGKERLEISISDNGPSISQAELHASADRDLAARLGGQVEVYSGPAQQEGENETRFTLLLPAGKG